MTLFDTLTKLAGLAIVMAVAVGAVLLLLRAGGPQAAPAGLEVGYPPERFPDVALARTPALADLAAVQSRLLTVYATLPPHSGAAVWMLTFLRELRAIMDTAYSAAVVARLYDDAGPLAALSAEVARIEGEVAAQLTRRLIERGPDDGGDDPLEARLAALRLCARELASATRG
ncbi:MAG: hypothetical protein HGA45_18100 [Chloroflexales bacterium]|nr:hypothetical protein [Chloroflexales bacterium]